ncbi:MAG: hypothetical protein KDA42_04995 [Planctomycetales bacterium]|nr:hypothetical protein [Planctomycetales bacterium]
MAASEAGNNEPLASVDQYPLLDALRHRRSRRFPSGAKLNGGPLAFQSQRPPQPLSIEEEALLAFAACGITGHALAELPYEEGDLPGGGGGNIMIHFIGRTVPSADALHFATVFVINDEGTWLLKRPQDYPRGELADVIDKSRRGEWVALYEQNRIKISDQRIDIPRQVPYVPPFNHWSANVPGTTYFIPVHELSANAINFLFAAFGEDFSYYLVDERNGYRSVGLNQFARSRGGHLYDDPKDGRVLTLGFFENWVCQLSAIEQGAIMQNLALMSQALGLGGFPHFAAHPYIWTQTLGFRMEQIPGTKLMGADRRKAEQLREAGRDDPVPSPVGLEHNGEVLIKPYCPPYYKNMEEAVLAFLEYKYGEGTGTFRDGGAATAWKNGAAMQQQMPKHSDQAVAATIAFCEYVYQRYGRIPTCTGPLHTILAYQAHRIDPEFYAEYFKPEALSNTQHAREGV